MVWPEHAGYLSLLHVSTASASESCRKRCLIAKLDCKKIVGQSCPNYHRLVSQLGRKGYISIKSGKAAIDRITQALFAWVIPEVESGLIHGVGKTDLRGWVRKAE